MSIARKCNRCSVYRDRRDYQVVVTDYSVPFEITDHEYDLCPDCALELDEFMRGAKPKNLLDRLLHKNGGGRA